MYMRSFPSFDQTQHWGNTCARAAFIQNKIYNALIMGKLEWEGIACHKQETNTTSFCGNTEQTLTVARVTFYPILQSLMSWCRPNVMLHYVWQRNLICLELKALRQPLRNDSLQLHLHFMHFEQGSSHIYHFDRDNFGTTQSEMISMPGEPSGIDKD